MNNKEFFSALEEKIASDCGRVEEIIKEDHSLTSTTLSGEEDYKERFIVVPKGKKIELYLIHEFDVGYWAENKREAKKSELKEVLGDNMEQCYFEDLEVDDDFTYFETSCSNKRFINTPIGTLKEISDEIIDKHFWEMTQKQWDETTKIIEKFNRDN